MAFGAARQRDDAICSVIASEAMQSIAPHAEAWIASLSLPRNDGAGSLARLPRVKASYFP
jgi:hypothetical protein